MVLKLHKVYRELTSPKYCKSTEKMMPADYCNHKKCVYWRQIKSYMQNHIYGQVSDKWKCGVKFVIISVMSWSTFNVKVWVFTAMACGQELQKKNRELFPLVSALRSVFWRSHISLSSAAPLNTERLKATIENWPFLSVCRWKQVSSHWLTSDVIRNAAIEKTRGVSVGLSLGAFIMISGGKKLRKEYKKAWWKAA